METKDETISRLKQKLISSLHHHAEHHRLEDSLFKEIGESQGMEEKAKNG